MFKLAQALMLLFLTVFLVPSYAWANEANPFIAMFHATLGIYFGWILQTLGLVLAPDLHDESDKILRAILRFISWIAWWCSAIYTLVTI